VKTTLPLITAALVLPAATHALERTAQQSYDDQVNWSALQNRIDLVSSQNKALVSTLDAIGACGAKKQLWNGKNCIGIPQPTCSCSSSSSPKSSDSSTPSSTTPKDPYFISNFYCSGSGNAGGIIGCYKSSLGRCADEGGITYYGNQMANDGRTLAEVCNEIGESSEASKYKSTGKPTNQFCPSGYTYRKNTQYCDPNK
jgi:hypothetical protein